MANRLLVRPPIAGPISGSFHVLTSRLLTANVARAYPHCINISYSKSQPACSIAPSTWGIVHGCGSETMASLDRMILHGFHFIFGARTNDELGRTGERGSLYVTTCEVGFATEAQIPS